jgi:hypothetical protein
MMHDDAVPLLPGWREGRLEKDLAAEVAAHVDSCGECPSLVEAYDTLRTSLDLSGADRSGHPSVEEIVAYAMGRAGTEDAARLEAHLAGCERCSVEVRAVRQAEEEAGRAGKVVPFLPRRAAAPSRVWRWANLAAVLVIAILVYPAYRGLVSPPDLSRRVQALEQEQERLAAEAAERDEALRRAEASRDWGGAVDLPLLSGAFRGEDVPPTTVTIRPDQPFAVLALDLAPPPRGSRAIYRFGIVDAEARFLWKHQMGATDLEDQMRRSGVLVLAVPAGLLPAGRHTLRVTSDPVTGPDPLLTAAFLVVRPDH